jgi:hypothetical protein
MGLDIWVNVIDLIFILLLVVLGIYFFIRIQGFIKKIAVIMATFFVLLFSHLFITVTVYGLLANYIFFKDPGTKCSYLDKEKCSLRYDCTWNMSLSSGGKSGLCK